MLENTKDNRICEHIGHTNKVIMKWYRIQRSRFRRGEEEIPPASKNCKLNFHWNLKMLQLRIPFLYSKVFDFFHINLLEPTISFTFWGRWLDFRMTLVNLSQNLLSDQLLTIQTFAQVCTFALLYSTPSNLLLSVYVPIAKWPFQNPTRIFNVYFGF